MAFSQPHFSFFFSIVILVQTVSAAGGVFDIFKPVTYQCPIPIQPDKNFSIGSQFEKNLDLVIYNLTITTPTTGFSYGSAGAVNSTDISYGRAQCRPDISTADCTTCVSKIARWIREKCPLQKSALAWFQGCQLVHSDVDFYGKINDRVLGCFLKRKQNLRIFPPAEQLRKFLVRLSERAAYESEKLFAKDVVKLTNSRNLYGMVECTQDVSRQVCKTCLDLLIKGSTTAYYPYAYGQGTQFWLTPCTLQISFNPF